MHVSKWTNPKVVADVWLVDCELYTICSSYRYFLLLGSFLFVVNSPRNRRHRRHRRYASKSKPVAKLATQVANLSTGPPPISYRLLTTSFQQTEYWDITPSLLCLWQHIRLNCVVCSHFHWPPRRWRLDLFLFVNLNVMQFHADT